MCPGDGVTEGEGVGVGGSNQRKRNHNKTVAAAPGIAARMVTIAAAMRNRLIQLRSCEG
jgi:hypothetical protein